MPIEDCNNRIRKLPFNKCSCRPCWTPATRSVVLRREEYGRRGVRTTIESVRK
ncbi:hypothetical protein OIU76_027239, partial [Salix suchowensis]